MLADYHVHSEFSDDSVFPVNDVCALAIERGIDEICFTDHVDFGPPCSPTTTCTPNSPTTPSFP